MSLRYARKYGWHSVPNIAAALLALCTAASASAGDSDPSMFSFSGFGTAGVVHSSEDQADFSSSIFKPNGAGYSHTWSTGVDSLIAAQVAADFTPQLSAVLQVISEQNHDGTYRPNVEWANIKYQFTPNFNARVGRTVLPVFLASDYRKVAYANPWVRPPLEVYGLVPITGSDGVDVNYSFQAGEFKHTLQGSYGNNEKKLTAGNGRGRGKFKRALSISDTVEYDALTLHFAYMQGNLSGSSIHQLFNVFRQFGPEGVALAEKYDSDATPLSFVGVGASYDPGDWFVMAEGGATDTHSVFGKKSAWYVSGGYRIGKFTPYLTYARARADHLSDPGLTVSALPPFLAGPATGLNAALNSILRGKAVQNTVSIGGRWDFMKNTALKLQFDRTDVGEGSNGVLFNTQPGFQPGGKFDVFSVAVDFVF